MRAEIMEAFEDGKWYGSMCGAYKVNDLAHWASEGTEFMDAALAGYAVGAKESEIQAIDVLRDIKNDLGSEKFRDIVAKVIGDIS